MTPQYTMYYSLTRQQDRRLQALVGAYNRKQGTNHSAQVFFQRMMGIHHREEIDRRLTELEKLYLN